MDGENGFLVEPGDHDGFVDAIRLLLSDDELRDRMREATLEEVKRHDIRSIAQEWEALYEELAASPTY